MKSKKALADFIRIVRIGVDQAKVRLYKPDRSLPPRKSPHEATLGPHSVLITITQ